MTKARDIADLNVTILDSVELNSDATDTTNVTSSGALMDSELTAIASVKALNQGVATTDSPAFAGLTLSGVPTAPTAASGTGTTQIATTAYTDAAITALIGGAPSTLDTLNEIAAAVSDDPDYVGTVNAALALKAPKASPTFTGAVTANGGVVVDTITIDGSTITSSGSLTLDLVGNLTIDVDGTVVSLSDGGVNFGQLFNSGAGNFNIYAPTSNQDIIFRGNDGGSTITALTLDMSAAGAATFSGDVSVPNISVADDIRHSGDSDTYISFEANNQTYYSGGTRALDLASGSAVFNEGGGDVDFRVEGNNRANLLVVDGGKDMIGIGMYPDQSWGSNSVGINFGIGDVDAGAITWQEISGADQFNFTWNAYNDNTNWKFASGNPASRYYQYNGSHYFQTAAATSADANITFVENLSLAPTAVVFNEGGVDADFRVESDTKTHALFLEGESGHLLLNSTAPKNPSSYPSTYAFTTLSATPGAIDRGAFLELVGTGGGATNYWLGDIGFYSTGNANAHAGIAALTDSGVNTGRLVFSTNTDASAGAASLSMMIDSDGAVTQPRQPAFLVTPASQQSDLSGTTTVALGTEIFDQGSNFASNTFTAPVTGKYQFNLSLYLRNFDVSASYVSFYIQASNRNIEMINSGSVFGATDPSYSSLAVSCLLDMDANDTCYIQCVQSGGAAQMDIAIYSRFSGFLVC